MRKYLVMMIALLLILINPSLAADIDRPSIQDNTAILSAQTKADADKLGQLLKDKTGVKIAVEIRHFLGGAKPDTYAQRLLEETENSQDTLLLLIVIGEEVYDFAEGSNAEKLIGPELLETLLSKNFRNDFLKRNYDKAVAGFMLSTAKEIAKQSSVVINTEGLFGYIEQQTNPPKSVSIPGGTKRVKLPDLNDILGDPISATSDPKHNTDRMQREDKGLSIGSIIIIGVVLSSIFGKNKRGRRKGCGCGPLGWIFGVFGLSKFFGWRE